jgi:N-acetylated-alpha-linked acidic dipeptidase
VKVAPVSWLATRLTVGLAAASAIVPGSAVAQDPIPVVPDSVSMAIAGFSPEAALAQRGYEQALLGTIDADSVARWARGLSSRPHVAGTPGQAATRDSVIGWHTAAGVQAGYDSLTLYMPYPLTVEVARTWPDPIPIDLEEPALDEDPASGLESVPVFNAYSGSGRVEAEVVFAGYGLPADYRTLDSAGVTVRGKIVLARYGRSFRGIKAREAEARGALGLLLYSDPEDDGFVKGDVYPAGPMRPPAGVQRGSILNATGDPSTPDGPSLPGAPRSPASDMELPHIPVVPIGYGPAESLLGTLGGPAAPESWQGGLDLTYRFGPGPTRVRVDVSMESGRAAYHPAYNTIAVVEGSEWPDEWVVIGGHRDAWGPGAIDNSSGSASVVEVARAFGALAAQGMRPRRTIVFATWDAEEWGIIGSIEWVEAQAQRLRSSVVAYVNQDAPVSGPRFGAAASPELKELARSAARRVPEPVVGGTVYEAWLARVAEGMDDGADPDPLPVGDLGGGSDHKGFYQHLGIPAIGFGFGGTGGVYHSMYDTPRWMQEFGDPGYLYHAAVARIAAVVVARLANAELVPFDYVGLADLVADRAEHLESDVEAALAAATATEHAVGDAVPGALDAPPTARAVRSAMVGLGSSIESLETAARQFDAARSGALGAGIVRPETARAVNERLRAASRALTSETGLPGDPWSRQLLFASDPDNGYAALPMPAVRLALRAGDLEAVAARVEDLSLHLEEVAEQLRTATVILEVEGSASN